MTLPYLDELKKSTRFTIREPVDGFLQEYVVICLEQSVKHNWLCSMGWSSRVYYDVEPERYNLETVANMKRMCKQNGIKGYSKLPSRELAKRLMSI